MLHRVVSLWIDGVLPTSAGRKVMSCKRRIHWRYIGPEWREIRLRAGLSEAGAIARSAQLYEKLRARGFSTKTVNINRLDNPYMTELGRAVIINDLRRTYPRMVKS